MRCSSFEPLLDAYLEGMLSARRARAVAKHLRGCSACEALLHELRVVDALLTTASTPGSVDSEFTNAIVSHARRSAPHAVKRTPLWVPLVGYLAVAWALVGLAALHASEFRGILENLAAQTARSLLAVDAAVRVVSPATSVLAAAVSVVLLVDAVLFFAVFYGYRRLRPVLAVYLARSPRP
ncbi:MAG TPA: zf-HC2 domain-containing protein [Candidatus Cybelea sp.]|jgi:anti-sigma factor RsiW|nr:zf-HC2 domain-containing protein [Candidatus Cybelea sp.]